MDGHSTRHWVERTARAAQTRPARATFRVEGGLWETRNSVPTPNAHRRRGTMLLFRCYPVISFCSFDTVTASKSFVSVVLCARP
jgi:hypothetical protein